MKLSEFIDKLDMLDVGHNDPEVYIRIGLTQRHVNKVEYFPEAEDEEDEEDEDDAVVLSGLLNR